MAYEEEFEYDESLESSGGTGFFESVGSGFAGAFNTFLGNYGTALGSRTDSFGGTRPAGVTDPAVQAQRNPLTGQLYGTQNPGAPRSNGSAFGSPVVLMALAGAAIVALVLLKR